MIKGLVDTDDLAGSLDRIIGNEGTREPIAQQLAWILQLLTGQGGLMPVPAPTPAGDMFRSDYATGAGKNNPNAVDHAMYADAAPAKPGEVTSPLTLSDGINTLILSINANGDFQVFAQTGPNAGKTANLSYGSWH